MSLYELTITQMTRVLGQVRRWLDKAQAYAEQKKFDPAVLLSARLAPDQWDLAMQIHIITVAPYRLSAMLQGKEPPKPEQGEATMAALRAQIDAAIEHLSSIPREALEGAEERMIPLPFMPGKGMKGAEFLMHFALPNHYFHVVTAYAILRHNGVDVGKMDYLGELSVRDL